ncbi:MAG: AMIN-like domain-containing (lipo)protein, partial [Yaniella sp.]
TPSYMAQYTDDPGEPGSGQPIDTGDSAYLEVIVSGTAAPETLDEDDLRNTDDAEMLEHGTQITDLETEATGTVVSFAPWEATSNYIIGLDEQRPYAVTLLEDPVRIIIDIQLDDEE